MGHVGLDVADAGGGGVFSGFIVVVEEVWGSERILVIILIQSMRFYREQRCIQGIFRARHDCDVGWMRWRLG